MLKSINKNTPTFYEFLEINMTAVTIQTKIIFFLIKLAKTKRSSCHLTIKTEHFKAAYAYFNSWHKIL